MTSYFLFIAYCTGLQAAPALSVLCQGCVGVRDETMVLLPLLTLHYLPIATPCFERTIQQLFKLSQTHTHFPHKALRTVGIPCTTLLKLQSVKPFDKECIDDTMEEPEPTAAQLMQMMLQFMKQSKEDQDNQEEQLKPERKLKLRD